MLNKKLLLFIVLNGMSVLYGIMISPRYYFFYDDGVVKLINAVRFRNGKKAKQLISRGVNINRRGRYNMTALYYFFLKRNYLAFRQMLELGADPYIELEVKGYYYLLLATMDIIDSRYFKALLDSGIDINYHSETSGIPLDYSLFSHVNIKYLKLLLKHGVNFFYYENPEKFWSYNPISTTLTLKNYKKLLLLLKYGGKEYMKHPKIWEDFLKDLRCTIEYENSILLIQQQKVVKYIRNELGVDIHLLYPYGKPRN